MPTLKDRTGVYNSLRVIVLVSTIESVGNNAIVLSRFCAEMGEYSDKL